ncbi:4-amino-6-deoxy-N-Acetyl-D-hexosaminyl-(Lipid carrier) acetyltrasferase [Desulfosporosinus sp. I2]|nr:4-amino-6-deoxy-N-Acetyl-D-hexosaminyl-(Lipid carrier) acetyltrasferase [Desulfosporosinus sp. I2]
MKDKVVILTYGGTGREIGEIASEQYTVIGFLDDVKHCKEILGKLEEMSNFDEEVKFISGLGSYRSMKLRRRKLEEMELNSFINLISLDAKIYKTATLGQGVVVFPQTIISVNSIIGDHVFIYHNCVISHDVIVKNYSMISNSVCVSGGVKIGENCYIGAGSTILEGVSIGDNCIIAAGATVLNDVEENKIYISNYEIKENKYNL